MMTLKFTPLPVFDSNYIWLVIHPTRQECYIVDPGDANSVMAYLDKTALEAKGILVTHSHNDHILGIDSLQKRLNIPVYGPKCAKIPWIDHIVGDNDQFSLWPDCQAHVMHVPGHLPEQHIYYLTGQLLACEALLCGDILFSSGCGKMFVGTPEEYTHSLDRICALPAQTQLFGAHEYTLANIDFALAIEPENTALYTKQQDIKQRLYTQGCSLPSDLATEKETNPFLRRSEPQVLDYLKHHYGRFPANDAEAFKWLRKQKDLF